MALTIDNILHGIGYRIGCSPRSGPTSAPDGFTVLNQTTGQVYIASGGVWTDGGIGTFVTSLFDEWKIS